MKAVVFGCGRMGARHVQALKGMGIDVAGLTDLRIESAQAAASQNNLPTDVVYADAATMLAATRPDLAVVATTAPSHPEYVAMAAEHGARKILCEKPLATSVRACDDIIALATSRGIDIAVNHQMRYMPQYTEPKALMQSEAFGGLQSIAVSTGNFGLSMNGTHYVEMMRFMFDEAPASVSAWFDSGDVPNPRGPEFTDKAGVVVLRTASGKTCTMHSREGQGHGMIVTYAGRYGQIVVDELAGSMYITRRDKAEDRALPTTRYGQPSFIETRRIQAVDIIASTQSVIRALTCGQDYPSAADAGLAVRALAAAYASDEAGHTPQSVTDSKLDERVFPWA